MTAHAYGSISEYHAVRQPSHSAAIENPPMPENKSPTSINDGRGVDRYRAVLTDPAVAVADRGRSAAEVASNTEARCPRHRSGFGVSHRAVRRASFIHSVNNGAHLS